MQFGWTVYHNSYNYNQAALTSQQLNQQVNFPASYQAYLQNYTQTATGFTTSLSYPIKRSFKRIGITYGLDDSSLQTFSTASSDYFEALEFRGIQGPNALNGIITSKIVPNFSYNKIDNPQRPHSGQSLYFATEFAGLGGNVKYIKPVTEYKKFLPVNKGRNTVGFRVLGSWISGYGGLVAPPADRFYMGGDTDIRGFDIRAISPVSFFPTTVSVPVAESGWLHRSAESGEPAPGRLHDSDPGFADHLPGWRYQHRDQPGIPHPDRRSGDAGAVRRYRIGLRLAGIAVEDCQPAGAHSELHPVRLSYDLHRHLRAWAACTFRTAANLPIVNGTNYQPRMSTGLELQVILPVVNAPFRVYWAYNPLRINETVNSPNPITRSMFPAGAAGDYTYAQAISTYQPKYYLSEPLKTFRFTVATTF